MPNGKGSALTIIALIIGAGGLGVGVFSMIQFQVVEGPQGEPGIDGPNGDDGLNGTLNNVVGIWEGMEGTGSNYNISLTTPQLSESGFFTLNEGDTALQLTTMGWYRFSIKFLWNGLDSTDVYWGEVLKNGVTDEIICFVNHPNGTSYMVETFLYVHSDGDDIFKLNCYSSISDSFSLYSDLAFNEFVLEYVKEM